MPISYSKEENAWSLRDVTQEEADLLIDLGKAAMLQIIGVGILKKMQEKMEQEVDVKDFLKATPQDQMGQA